MVDVRDATIIKAGAFATVAEVAVGDPIAVIGPAQGNAVQVRLASGAAPVVTQPQGKVQSQNSIVGGTVVAIAPNAISLLPKGHPGKPARPIIPIDIGTQTTIMSAGQSVLLDALTIGSHVVVSGTRNAQGVITAEKIVIQP